jgi:hypothetical protein
VAARPGTDQNQTIDTGLQRLFGMADADHVMKDLAAVGMHMRHDGIGRAQAGDNQRHLVFHAECHVVFEALVRLVNDLIDRKWCGIRIIGQRGLDVRQPFIERLFRPGVKGREGADQPALALGNHQIGIGNDEHRRADHRQRQPFLQRSRNCHYAPSFNARRRILPTLVRGKSARNSTCLGTL